MDEMYVVMKTTWRDNENHKRDSNGRRAHMRIIADSATLFSPEEGEALGVTIIPACVVLDGKTYRDYIDISSQAFLEKIKEGGIPTSSQPAIGDVMDVFEGAEEDVFFFAVGDGLSGTYQNAVGAKNCLEPNDHIHVFDSKSLAGPERYMVKKALELVKAGASRETIIQAIDDCIESSVSFVIPVDFDFLKRSGRLTPIAAKVGGLIKIVPVMTQTEDKTRIELFTIKRSRKKAVAAIIEHLKTMGVNEEYLVTIGHGGAPDSAESVLEQVKEAIPEAEFEILELAPALITHGGPGCITVQAVRK